MHKTTLAFAVNETGISVPLEQAHLLRIYSQRSGEWIVSREWSLSDLRITLSESVGDAVRALSAFLQDCFTLVAGDFPEPVRRELEREGLDLWELRGEPTELAEVILSDEALLAA